MRLPGENCATRLIDGFVKQAAGKKYQGGLQNGGEQGQERRKHQGKLDHRRAVRAADETLRQPERDGTAARRVCFCFKHVTCSDADVVKQTA